MKNILKDSAFFFVHNFLFSFFVFVNFVAFEKAIGS